MKNVFRFIGIIAFAAIIGFSFLTCENEIFVEPTSGTLTIRGLSDYNGKNVIAWGYSDSTMQKGAYIAGKNLVSSGDVTYAPVANNVATLSVWKASEDLKRFSDYTGTNQSVYFLVICYETKNSLGAGKYGVIGKVTVNFQGGGTGEGNFEAVDPY